MKKKSEKAKADKVKTKKKPYEKIIIWTIVGICLLNFLLVLGFFIYLYKWLKVQ